MQWLADVDTRFQPQLEELARAAILCHPDKPGGWLTLGKILLASGRLQEALACLDEALSLNPASTDLIVLLATIRFELREFEPALQATNRAIALSPDSKAARILRMTLLAKMGLKIDEEEIEGDLPLLTATSADLFNILARAKRLDKYPEKLIALCDSLLSRYPAHTKAIFNKAVSLAKLGRSAEACELIALDRFVEISELAIPPEFRDGETFRGSLAREIRRNPTMVADPAATATRGGFQTLSLCRPDAPTVAALMGQIKTAVDDYEKRLQSHSHGFVSSRPKTARISAWAVIYGSGGSQVSHLHPDGWISGVFYVSASRMGEESAQRGSLVLGALDPEEHGCAPPWGTFEIEPLPGRLVLFPSYMPHAVLPTSRSGERIVVAFDIVPGDETA